MKCTFFITLSFVYDFGSEQLLPQGLASRLAPNVCQS
jgi:hypothetical protein